MRHKLFIMATKTIEYKITNCIKKRGRGTFMFAADFVRYGEQKSINKALERMRNDGIIILISRGMYYYPHIDRLLGLGVLFPPLEDIASAIAKRDKARIVPTGLFALNRLGFSTQVPMNAVFLTDGYPRKVNLTTGGVIQFKRTSPKNLAFNSELAMLLTFALKSLGRENITQDIIDKTRSILKNDEAKTVKGDFKLMPSWISSIIKKLYEE